MTFTNGHSSEVNTTVKRHLSDNCHVVGNVDRDDTASIECFFTDKVHAVWNRERVEGQTKSKSIVSYTCQAVGKIDGLKVIATSKSRFFDTCHVVGDVDRG